ncbi:MAG: DUF4397 domain-containing protein [Pseudomonadota bacterium]
MRLFSLARLACLAAVTFALAGCGGKADDDEISTVRFLNATTGVGSLDFYVDDDKKAALAADALGDYFDYPKDSHSVKVKPGGASSSLHSSSYTLETGERYTAVAWGSEGAVRLAFLQEDEDAPSAGEAKVRLFNAAPDVGALDLYLTAADTSLDAVSSLNGAIASGSFGGYVQVGKGSYRLRITGAGNKSDIRLDLPSVTLGEKDRTTIIVQAGSGGVLVHALLLVQEGGVATAKNDKARMRLVSSLSANGNASATVGSSALSTAALTSPAVGTYVLVPSSKQDLVVQVNGATALGSTLSVSAGADYTLMIYGNTSNPQMNLITDDNRLPASGKGKLRMVHGAEGHDLLSLALDSLAVADAGYGVATSYYAVNPNSGNALIEVTSPLSSTPLYTTARTSGSTGVSIESQGVYTVFLLGGGSAPRGMLRRER